MMYDKVLSLLGIARRAGKLSTGHDAAVSSIVKDSAKLRIVSSDASQRLKREISHSCTFGNKDIPVILADFTGADLSAAIGIKAAVITVDDEGFAKRIRQLYGSEQ